MVMDDTQADDTGKPNTEEATEEGQPKASDAALVKEILSKIRKDKAHHKQAFAKMREDMRIARTGCVGNWDPKDYTANIIGRHVKQKTAALYAKNPKAVAGRRETLDFAIWDENPDSLKLAYMTWQQAQQQMMAAPPAVNPMTGMPVPPQMPPEAMTAKAVLDDFTQGMQRRQKIEKIGKTLEVLFAHAMDDQKPVDFKTAMKKLVRRACTTGVGYIEVLFERETGAPPEVVAQMNDAKARLAHLQQLMDEAQEGEIEADDAEMAELEKTIAALMNEPEIVLREGIVFDFPRSTKVIPDRRCTSLVGFEGARHLTLEYLYTPDEIDEMFDVDIGGSYTPYKDDDDEEGSPAKVSEDGGGESGELPRDGLVCVYKHYDRVSGLVYYLADGYPDYLRKPSAPDVFVDTFWPVHALTFNAVEDEDDEGLFPPSDVQLLRSMQDSYNKSRQGKQTHRKAALPRWGYPKGGLEEEDVAKLSSAAPFSAVPLNLGPNEKISDKLQPIPVPGVDPNLYDTGEVFTDVQLVGGAQEANYGGVAKATATESAIAANATASSDSTSVDDLDSFLTRVVRATGQIMLKEMSPEVVKQIAGPGAEWPEGMTLSDIANDVYLDIEAGSSGKPNQAIEIKNWQMMLPFLVQIPNINPMWIARQTIKRLDDKADLTEAIAAGIPSIMLQNAQKQIAAADPMSNPNMQGGQGAANAPAPTEQQPGSDPAFGSNQTG